MTRRIPVFVLTVTAFILLTGSPTEAAGEPCGAGAGNACASDEFCKLPVGDCGTAGVAGVCTPRPQDCPAVFDPVCGCDGQTYGNECEADQAGTPIARPGTCDEQVCGGIAGIPCENGEICKLPTGQCNVSDLQGVCVPFPTNCPLFFDPVCGCDGVTYNNECEADQAGAQIDHPGVCEPRACSIDDPTTCNEGEFCKRPPGQCDATDLGGECHPIPDACPAVFDPVCGCDGVTYNNECEADRAGAAIDHPGECVRICGGIAGIPCEAGEYCQFADGTCDIADNQGVCRPMPQACPDVWLPVCGCDGVTYGNRCEAAAVGAQIDHEGECGPEVCDGFAGIPCSNPDDFCLHRDGECLTFDGSGICVPVPGICPEIYDPVCGCDGRTYGNRCEALIAGVQVDQPGVCPPQVCGGIAGIPCDDGEFCKLPAGECDTADLQGVCTPIPLACPLFYDPVCGCDGVTYGNACEADRAGAQVDHPGECDRVCGGIAGIPCDSDEYCQFPDGTCDIVDNQGVCRPIPLGCPDVWLPVCGCDGRTYGNRCEAAAVGAQIDYEGECQPQVCGGIAGIPCDDGEFCKLPAGECDTADLQGVCTPIPDGCFEIYDPVCGCDGVTYGNECEADRAGAQVDHPGECDRVCGGIAGIPCDSDEYCQFPDGTCDIVDNQGVCRPIPQGCPDVWLPVCGCDGQTYGNRCEAAAVGAQIDYEGECQPQVCGGIAGTPCDDGEFCKLPAGECDTADLQGVCTPIPDGCFEIYDPVCGCDGVTYGNECEADRAGAQVDHPGECDRVCGGIAGIPCDSDEYCQFPDGTCDIVDNQGVCRPIPQGCPDVWLPVCGCDGQTYGNRCEAAAVGAQIDYEGECQPQVCGGIAGIPCDDGEFCKLPAGECDTADLQGVCTPIPLACPLFYDPVCGCDGVTYDNECDADRAGAQIDHPGACEQVCGGLSGITCDEGEYCVFPDGTCDVQDLLGVCRPIPQACPDVWDPVCGCDGVTYGNRCEAAAAQVQIASEGECEQICGGFIGIPCDEGEYCMYPNGTCNFADHFGTCVTIPDECPEVCHPVCGCDGATFGNLCLAQQAQVSLDHRGECDPAGRLIRKVRFDSPERMRWQPAPAALSYNAYVEVHETPPPADAGECYLSGINAAGTIIAESPDQGKVWLIQVTGVFADGEGPMGTSSDCTFRAPELPCDQQ